MIPDDDIPALTKQLEELPMGGLEASREIRFSNKFRNRPVPIVALTAHAMFGDKEKYLEQGFDFYMSKPINRGALIDAVSELTNRYFAEDKE